MQIQLIERDLQLLHIEEEIKNKKKLLIKKKKELDKKKKTNLFLQDVQEDYTKYYNHIVEEKQNQLGAMKLLKEYIDDLVKTDHLMSHQLKSAKHDQKQILGEIEKLKTELDEIIGG
jgi:hypothetical protein